MSHPGDSTVYTPSVRIPLWPRLFRGLIIAIAGVCLLLGARRLSLDNYLQGLLLSGLILLSRYLPVAVTREKPITFTAAFIFAASLLINGIWAGYSALLACVLHGLKRQRSGRFYALFSGAQYALSALLADAVFVRWAGHPFLSVKTPSADFSVVLGAALVFIVVSSLASYLGDLGTRYGRPSYRRAILRAQALAYPLSFPFAILMVFGYRVFDFLAILYMAALYLASVQAMRMTLENRVLSQQLRAVQELGRACASGVRPEQPLQRFLTLAHQLVAFQGAVLWLTEEESTLLKPRAVYPVNAPFPDASAAGPDTLIGRVMHREEPLIVPDASREPRLPNYPHPETWALFPLLLHGRCIGVAQFIRGAARPFTWQEVKRLSALVPQAAVAFESVRVRHLMHRFADMATTDGLTGLLNHRRSQEVLQDEIRRAARYRHSLAVLMLDVDFFKQFNDKYGHPQGDLLLREIARILRANVRTVDSVGRYGGEEFIIILPETTRSEACILAERIRATVEGTTFLIGEEAIRKTISIGVSAYPEDASEPVALIQRADEALYRAKRQGKNRVLTV